MAPARTIHAMKAMAAVNRAVQAAIAPNREGSPPDNPPSVEPMSSEMAEVTLMDVCRELQKIQKTSPEKRHA